MKTRKKRSAVWKFFDPTTVSKARCLVCDRIVTRLSTSNLRKHIKTHHPSEYADLEAMDAAKRDSKKGDDGATVAKIERVFRINPLETSYSRVRTQGENSSEDECSSKQPRNKRGYNETMRDINNDDDSSQSTKRRKKNCALIPLRSIKRESEDEESEGAGQQSEAVEDLWHYFVKLPPNRAKCILCKVILSRDSLTLTQHINEKHRKVALDRPSDSDDDQRDIYTEVVYLEDEQPIDSRTINVKSTKNYEEVRPKKRRLSSRMYEELKSRVQRVECSESRTEVKSDADEEIENFGRYVIGLLKKLPKDVCTQLQMDIINMVMKAKLKVSAPPEPVNVTVSSIQDGVVFTPVSVSSANVIVTNPSDSSYSGQNGDSMPSIEIVVENDKES